MNGYAKWAQAHAAGMAAAADTRERHPCGIKGCKRTAYKGRLCRAHWNLVPVSEKVALVIATMQAQRKVAERHHRWFLRNVQAQVKSS